MRSHIYKSMKSVFSNISILLIALIFSGLLEITPVKAMMLDSMQVEITNCQDCTEAGNMKSVGAACSSVCVVSVIADKAALDATRLRTAEKTQFERQISRLKERGEFPEPHPPKHTS
jgi:hypothetical protein